MGLGLLLLAADATHADDRAGVEFFEQKIRPVLVEHCYACHSDQADELKGGLRLDHREGLLNGGESGSGAVAGFIGKTPDGFYEADGSTPVAANFTATTNANDTLAALSAGDIAVPADANDWTVDTTSSPLSPAYTGSYPQPMSFGWYTYYPTHAVAAAGLSPHLHLGNGR